MKAYFRDSKVFADIWMPKEFRILKNYKIQKRFGNKKKVTKTVWQNDWENALKPKTFLKVFGQSKERNGSRTLAE